MFEQSVFKSIFNNFNRFHKGALSIENLYHYTFWAAYTIGELLDHTDATLVVRINESRREKTGFCICKNKDADQLCGNREADQRLCFRYTDTTIPLLSKSEIASL